MFTDLLTELTARGQLKDVTDPELRDVLARESLTLYCGFDPSGPTLHIGNLVPLVAMRRFQQAGHRVIALVGGATGMIGDPSGRDVERDLLDADTVAHNVAGIRADIERVLPGADVRDNREWIAPLNVIEFLRDIGKHFRVNEMLRMDSVRDRLERQSGLSYTEFSYSLIQAYDYWHLYRTAGCRLQLGASDQWGNIVSGLDFIRTKLAGRADAPKAYGLTLELLLDDQGKKFGKSTGGGSLWLSAAHTSPFRFYQYFLSTRDDTDVNSEVERYLKTFTFLTLDEISDVMRTHASDKPARLAQRTLAEHVTRLVHGAEALALAERATDVLFGQDVAIEQVDEALLAAVFEDVPHATLPAAELDREGVPVVDLFVATGLCGSKAEAKRKVKEGGAYLNDRRVGDPQAKLTRRELHGKTFAKLRKGKREPALVRFA